MGDRASFTAFMRDASSGVQRTAWLLTGDWSAAEDLAQDAFVKTWQHWDRIDPAAAHGYVRRVMVRTFIARRSRRWTGEVSLGWLPERVDERETLDQVDTRAVLLSALLSLPRQQRAVVVLRFYDDLTETATSEALGCSVGTVKSHTARAMKSLRHTPGLAPAADERTLG